MTTLHLVRRGFGADAVAVRAGVGRAARDPRRAVADGLAPDTVLLLEHPPVYTAGQAHPAARTGPSTARPVVDVDRGGRITWHGPGQLVGYPIVRLPDPVDVVGVRAPARGGC